MEIYRSIKKVYVLLDGTGEDSFQRFQEGFFNLFPYLDISSDIYLISEDITRGFLKIRGIIEQVTLFLREYSFYRINIHPVHWVPPGDILEEVYGDFFNAITPFNKEGYLHQSVSRIMILPVLAVESKYELDGLDKHLDFLRNRMMIPCVHIPGDVPPSVAKSIVSSEKERIYMELSKGGKLERVMDTLGVHSVFDDLTTWVNAPVKGPVQGCCSLVFTEDNGSIFNCFKKIHSDRPVSCLYSGHGMAALLKTLEEKEYNRRECLTCGVESLDLMMDALKMNGREEEIGGISLHIGMELVKEEDYKRGLDQFDRVLKYHNQVEDLGTTLLSKALCHLKQNQLKEAEAALDETEKHIPSSGMIYYYRGLCEFGFRDYIEAIDRFNDALKKGDEELPVGDVYFYMGVSHINIEEYEDGLAMMNHAEMFTEYKSPVYYYMGICHLGMQDYDMALGCLKKAIASPPQKEDLGSIYFHLGLCYKEMERYEEAISELKMAREVEAERNDIHNLMGYCYFKLKEHDQAIQCFIRALEINPKSAIDYANLGVNLREKGETDKAVPMFKKALDLDPTIGFAKKHLMEIEGSSPP